MIRHWVILDLDVFRREHNSASVRCEDQSNSDGTYFIAYDIRSFSDALVVACSPTMARVLEHGVGAINRWPSKSGNDADRRFRELMANAPDLQQWIATYDGYHNIPWDKWEAANELWEQQRREISWPK